MNTGRTPARETRIPVGLLVFAASAAWLLWRACADVSVGDSGEVGSAAYVLGVAHPTGFPLDMLWLKATAFLPFGAIAFRQNVGVAVTSATALGFHAALAVRVCERAQIGDAPTRAAAAVFGASLLMTFGTFIDSALAVEVYSTSLLLLLVAANAALLQGRARTVAWAAFGLSLGTHVTGGFLMLPLLLAMLAACETDRIRMLSTRAVVVLSAALVIAYLPLASLRNPALDWGDPETVSRLFAHLTAARIRSSYAKQMFGAADSGVPGLNLVRQLFEHGWWLLPGLLGVVVMARRASSVALVFGTIFVLDLGYAVWINPMGIEARQLGHASGAAIALACSIGVASGLEWMMRARVPRSLAIGVVGAASLVVCATAAWPEADDGYVIAERYGAGGSMSALPPRSVLFCSSDAACSAALFALYVEDARPDMDVVPAQHLWEPTIRRRLDHIVSVQRVALNEVAPPELRRNVSDFVLRQLLSKPSARPLIFEEGSPIIEAMPKTPVAVSVNAPFVEPVLAWSAAPNDPGIAISKTRALMHARFAPSTPQSRVARDAWFEAFQTLGSAALWAGHAANAVDAFREAAQLLPLHAPGLANLGVALEADGNFAEAIEATRRSIELDMSRPTPWVNLARLSLRTQGPAAAREVIAVARKQGIVDARLDAMAKALEAQGKTGK